MLKEEEILLILYTVLVITVLIVFVVVFVIAFQKRKNKMLLEKLEAEKRFEKELATTQIEIQEQTFKNIAWELHDNIGQLLSVANMQLGMLSSTAPEDLQSDLQETKDIIGSSVQELRMLNRTLNNEIVLHNGLITSVKNELERFHRMKFLTTHFEVQGEDHLADKNKEMIIFRILQEFFSNVTKHSKAENLFVTLTYHKDMLDVLAKDDGVGFEVEEVQDSSGLQNMKSRASLIEAKFNLSSIKGKGTTLSISCPY